jgi:hypothetical protein
VADRGAGAAGGTHAGIGALMNLAAGDPETLQRMSAFVQRLQANGWMD